MTVVVAEPFDVLANFAVPPALDAKDTVNGDDKVARLLKLSRNVMVKAAVADVLATTENGADVMVNTLATGAVTVSDWVEVASPLDDAVMVGVPVLVSP